MSWSNVVLHLPVTALPKFQVSSFEYHHEITLKFQRNKNDYLFHLVEKNNYQAQFLIFPEHLKLKAACL